jgi:hypothetical protein
MKSGKTLTGLATELERQAQSKRDFLADTRLLQVRPDQSGNIVLDGVGGGMPMRMTAHEQMANTLNIPTAYYKRLMSDAPDLLAKNVNHWLMAGSARKMVRTLDGGVRAILSDRYRPLDNVDLIEATVPKLVELGATILSSQVTESRLYVKAVTPRVQGEVKVGDTIQAGIVISNSEIGAGSLRLEEMTYRLACLNGAIHAHAIRKSHVGRQAYTGSEQLDQNWEFFRSETRQADDRAFFLKVQDTVATVLSERRFRTHLDAMRGATEQKITADPVAVVEVTAKQYGLGQTERGHILKHLIEGADLSKFGLANAVTRASQDVDDYEIATAMEEAGGRIFEMPKHDWETLGGSPDPVGDELVGELIR